jgi:hypothetical protein
MTNMFKKIKKYTQKIGQINFRDLLRKMKRENLSWENKIPEKPWAFLNIIFSYSTWTLIPSCLICDRAVLNDKGRHMVKWIVDKSTVNFLFVLCDDCSKKYSEKKGDLINDEIERKISFISQICPELILEFDPFSAENLFPELIQEVRY